MSSYISLLTHMRDQLTEFGEAIPDAMQARDPKLLHPPLKATEICEALNKTVLHELTSPRCEPFLRETLHWEIENILSCLNSGLPYCLMADPIPYRSTIEEYRTYLLSCVAKTKDKIKKELEPIIQKMHEDAEKEHGQPMAFAIGRYKPWDAPPEPVPEFLLKLRESICCEKAVLLTVSSTSSNEHWRTCDGPKGIEGKSWPYCCDAASRECTEKGEKSGWTSHSKLE